MRVALLVAWLLLVAALIAADPVDANGRDARRLAHEHAHPLNPLHVEVARLEAARRSAEGSGMQMPVDKQQAERKTVVFPFGKKSRKNGGGLQNGDGPKWRRLP